jgi:hypothetical protein
MNALDFISEPARSDPYWVGSLSASAAAAYSALKRNDPATARHQLKHTLDDFLRSPLPSEELRSMLREEMR